MEALYGVAPTHGSYNALFSWLARRDWRAAEALLVEMTNTGLAPDRQTMDHFLAGYTLGRQERGPEHALSLAQHCFNQYKAKPSKKVFLDLVAVLNKVTHGDAQAGAPDPPHKKVPVSYSDRWHIRLFYPSTPPSRFNPLPGHLFFF